MAKYKGPFELTGSVGNLTFSNNGLAKYVKEKSGPTAEQVLTGDNFVNTLANAKEFTAAIVASQLVRHAIPFLMMRQVSLAGLNGRMNGLLLRVIKSDPVSDRGERIVSLGNQQLLTGFDFNKRLLLHDALPVLSDVRLRPQSEKMLVTIPGFRSFPHEAFPAGATHFRIVSCVLSINFDKRLFVNAMKESELLLIGEGVVGPVCLEQAIARAPGQTSLWLLGVVFYKLERGQEQLLKGGALKICRVSSFVYRSQLQQ